MACTHCREPVDVVHSYHGPGCCPLAVAVVYYSKNHKPYHPPIPHKEYV